jgi:TRAP-type C4-dicarboxylate transport system permease small subunit
LIDLLSPFPQASLTIYTDLLVLFTAFTLMHYATIQFDRQQQARDNDIGLRSHLILSFLPKVFLPLFGQEIASIYFGLSNTVQLKD